MVEWRIQGVDLALGSSRSVDRLMIFENQASASIGDILGSGCCVWWVGCLGEWVNGCGLAACA